MILDGAAVRISMVGFGQQVVESPTLDGREVQEVNSDLTAGTDLGLAKKLPQNAGIAFQGTIKGGGFDIEDALALAFLQSPNPSGRPNSDVVRPWLIGRDIQARPQRKWIPDFGVGMSLEAASRYEAPFEHVKAVVRPQREKTNYAKPDSYPFWQLWLPAQPPTIGSTGNRGGVDPASNPRPCPRDGPGGRQDPEVGPDRGSWWALPQGRAIGGRRDRA